MPEQKSVTIYRWTETTWAWSSSYASPTMYYVQVEGAGRSSSFSQIDHAMAYCQGERNAYQRLGYDVIVIDAAPPGED